MSGVTHFYSDPHFGHRRICELAGRPFADVDAMDRELVSRYRDSVGSNDVVLWLGDCFLCPKVRAKQIMDMLPGTKLLVLGNHDDKPARMARLGFDVVVEHELRMFFGGRRVRVCHYPPREHGCEGDHRYGDRMPVLNKGEVALHGHTHQRERRVGRAVHVGVDAWDYAPAPFDDVMQLVMETDHA